MSTDPNLQVGVDVGGTFTDFVALDPERGWVRLKRPTSRPDPSLGVLSGLAELGYTQGEVSHGTTMATNTALERNGPRLALVTTAGFRDLLLLGRGERRDLYAVQSKPRPSLIDPENCFEVDERLDSQGRVLVPLDAQQIETLARQLQQQGLQRVVVSLLFSYLNPDHELQVESIFRNHGLQVTLGHRVDPQPKEYERTSTAALQAYLEPSLRAYLESLESNLQGALWVVRSSGAVTRPQEAIEQAVGCLLSGPAAGLQGAWQLAQSHGVQRLLTVDVGGTSTDVALCHGSLPHLAESEIGGLPFRCPQTDIHTIGAGGGSVAYRDSSGLLQVGPRSAGSDPGPAAYGKGGPPTVCDALLYLGRLPHSLAGGALQLDLQASARAIEDLAAEMQLDSYETAAAIVELAEEAMVSALRLISLERGHDPSRCTLMAFGGGGGSHACSLAERLGIEQVMIPPRPGLLCAEGALLAPWQGEQRQSWSRVWTPEVAAEIESWREQAAHQLRQHAPRGKRRWKLMWEVRYHGQGHSLWVVGAAAQLAGRFQRLHQRRFDYARSEAPLEVVTTLLRAEVHRQTPPTSQPSDSASVSARISNEQGYWGLPPQRGGIQVVDFGPGMPDIAGPARLETMDGTVWLAPGWKALAQPDGTLLLQLR